jgi:sporulation protein YlmC with PRC-barrel domain
MKREIHLELLIGKQVVDADGKPMGRIEEILAQFSAWTIGLAILHRLGARKIRGGFKVPWDKLDLTDPDRPRLTCTVDRLQALSERSPNEDRSQNK